MSTDSPRHVAVVMDGNGRWAQQRGLPRVAGHRAGVKAARSAVQYFAKHQASFLSLFAFSSENWQRPKREVEYLLNLFARVLKTEVSKLHKNNIKVIFVGDRSRFNDKLLKQINQAEQLTADNTGMCLVIAVNYGGRWDLLQAVKNISQQVAKQEVMIDEIDELRLNNNIATNQIPDVDLFIRTSGEQRISNFYLWQSAYAELYFTEILWPDVNDEVFAAAMAHYKNRQRRFGCTAEQITTHLEEGSC